MNRKPGGTAAVLAGGKSLRFGRDKSFADCSGVPIIEYITLQLKDLFDDVLIISGRKDDYGYLGYPVVPDRIPGIGPLGGIHAALKEGADSPVFITACDMPFVSKSLVSHMRSLLAEHPYDAVAAKQKGFPEPLHAFYSPALSPGIEAFAARGGRKISEFLQSCDCCYIEEATVSEICSREKSLPFLNINTMDDFLLLKRILS